MLGQRGAPEPGRAAQPAGGGREGGGTACRHSPARFASLPQFPQAHSVPLAARRGRAEIWPWVSRPCHECIGRVLCPRAVALGTGGCQLLLQPGWMLCPRVCPGRKRLKSWDFLAAVLGREGDLQKCFASSVAPAGLAECLRVSGSCWSETELETQLEFGLSSPNLSPGLNISFPPPTEGSLARTWHPSPSGTFGVLPRARR